jgi:hypothetical protein
MLEAIANGVRPRAEISRDSFDPIYPFDPGAEDLIFMIGGRGGEEIIAPNFMGFVQRAYRDAPIVFGAIANRMHLFRQARFQFRRWDGGRPSDLFGDPSLGIVEHPWPGATTSTMLALAEVTNACAGNFFMRRDGDRFRVMRPDWTRIVLGSMEDESVGPLDLSADLIGYAYEDGGPMSGKDPVFLAPEEVVHYMPTPDPETPWRGMAWLSPIVEELAADKEMTRHKRAYLKEGATPNLGVVLDPDKLNIKTTGDFKEWVKTFDETRRLMVGGNPYKTLFTVGGADPKILGANLDQIDFAAVQGSGEVRIAVAAMVHPAILAIEAGLKGSALNAGNFEAAFRQFANGTIRPLWGEFAGALERVIGKPADQSGRPQPNVQIWYDDRYIPALQEDIKKQADTLNTDAATASTFYMAGWDPDSIIDAIARNDITLLKGKHSGRPSVQTQPGTTNGSTANGAGEHARIAIPSP